MAALTQSHHIEGKEGGSIGAFYKGEEINLDWKGATQSKKINDGFNFSEDERNKKEVDSWVLEREKNFQESADLRQKAHEATIAIVEICKDRNDVSVFNCPEEVTDENLRLAMWCKTKENIYGSEETGIHVNDRMALWSGFYSNVIHDYGNEFGLDVVIGEWTKEDIKLSEGQRDLMALEDMDTPENTKMYLKDKMKHKKNINVDN